MDTTCRSWAGQGGQLHMLYAQKQDEDPSETYTWSIHVYGQKFEPTKETTINAFNSEAENVFLTDS